MTLRVIRGGVLLTLMALVSPSPLYADELGRLFTTPSERLALDRARPSFGRSALPLPEAPTITTEGATPPPTARPSSAPSPSALTYRGVVRRGDGRVWVWLGDDAAQDSRGLKHYGPTAAGLLHVPTRHGTVLLKPGQRLDFKSGVISEGVAAGAASSAPVAETPASAVGVP